MPECGLPTLPFRIIQAGRCESTADHRRALATSPVQFFGVPFIFSFCGVMVWVARPSERPTVALFEPLLLAPWAPRFWVPPPPPPAPAPAPPAPPPAPPAPPPPAP